MEAKKEAIKNNEDQGMEYRIQRESISLQLEIKAIEAGGWECYCAQITVKLVSSVSQNMQSSRLFLQSSD